jgi:hypothetical protein
VWSNGFLTLDQNRLDMPLLYDSDHPDFVEIDPQSLEAVQHFDRVPSTMLLTPQDKDKLVTSTLPSGVYFRVPGVGDICPLWDSSESRILITLKPNGKTGKDARWIAPEVKSFKPGTFKTDGTVLSTAEIEKDLKGNYPKVIGNPDKGPFALYAFVESQATRTAFFTQGDWARLEIDPSVHCYDASPHGFLVATGKNQVLTCLDPKTGEVKWSRKEFSIGMGDAFWVGDYVVFHGNRDGEDRYPIQVLDGDTGETASEMEVPQFLRFKFVIGDIIVADIGDSTTAFQLVKK